MKQCKLGRHNEINVTFDNKTYDYVGFMVYAIIFPDGKEYIGRTCRLNERVKQHIRNLYGKRTPVGREMDRQRKFKVKNLRICHSESEVKRVEYDTIYNRSLEIVRKKTGIEKPYLKHFHDTIKEVLINEKLAFNQH